MCIRDRKEAITIASSIRVNVHHDMFVRGIFWLGSSGGFLIPFRLTDGGEFAIEYS